jgi:hypothetical protein
VEFPHKKNERRVVVAVVLHPSPSTHQTRPVPRRERGTYAHCCAGLAEQSSLWQYPTQSFWFSNPWLSRIQRCFLPLAEQGLGQKHHVLSKVWQFSAARVRAVRISAASA